MELLNICKGSILNTSYFDGWTVFIDLKHDDVFLPLFPASILESKSDGKVFESLVISGVPFAVFQDEFANKQSFGKKYDSATYCWQLDFENDLDSYDLFIIQLVRFELCHILFLNANRFTCQHHFQM